MGSPKPLLEWHGVRLVEYQVRCLLEGGASEVVVVLGHRAKDVIPFIRGPNVRYVVNSRYREGKTTSIKAGLEVVSPDADAIALLAVDQPRTVEIVSRIVTAHIENNTAITSPRYHGHGGHPLIFSARLRSELENISEENEGLRQVFQNHLDEITKIPIDDPMIRLDLNTPEAYESAKRIWNES
jgi:molybdenum cofactor cytidylyltransferase